MRHILGFYFLGLFLLFDQGYARNDQEPVDPPIQICLNECIQNQALTNTRGHRSDGSMQRRSASSFSATNPFPEEFIEFIPPPNPQDLANYLIEMWLRTVTHPMESIAEFCESGLSELWVTCSDKCAQEYPGKRVQKLQEIVKELREVGCKNKNETEKSLECFRQSLLPEKSKDACNLEKMQQDFAESAHEFVDGTKLLEDKSIFLPGKELCKVIDSMQPCVNSYFKDCGETYQKALNLLSDHWLMVMSLGFTEDTDDRCVNIVYPAATV